MMLKLQFSKLDPDIEILTEDDGWLIKAGAKFVDVDLIFRLLRVIVGTA
jgi:hypothetical protein